MKNGFFEQDVLLYKLSEFENLLKESGVDSQKDFSKIFTEKELDCLVDKYKDRKLFGKFLLKKIITKYIKSDKYTDVEILNDDKGKPFVVLYNCAVKKIEELDLKQIVVSISHSKKWITVMAVFEY